MKVRHPQFIVSGRSEPGGRTRRGDEVVSPNPRTPSRPVTHALQLRISRCRLAFLVMRHPLLFPAREVKKCANGEEVGQHRNDVP